MNPVTCTSCGTPLEPHDAGPPETRRPCPQCGSDARTVHISGTAVIGISVTGTATVVTYPETLLSAAKGLIEVGEHSIATVVIHMACEVAAERALSNAFVAQGMSKLEEAVEALLPGYNLGNERVRKLYVALTGKEIHKQTFWPDFCASATRRNQAIHQARIIAEAEARISYSAGQAIVAYLK